MHSLGGMKEALDRAVRAVVRDCLAVKAGEEVLVERAPVHSDSHRLSVIDRRLHDGGEVGVPVPRADVAGVDAILVQRGRACRILREQQVPVVMEVADERHIETNIVNSATTDLEGRFRFPYLRIGRYDVTVRLAGAILREW